MDAMALARTGVAAVVGHGVFRTIRLSGSVIDVGSLRACVLNRDSPRSDVFDRDGLGGLQLEPKR